MGISYMCMDCFIKQYTMRYDCSKFLNPLLKGISYGRFLQTSLFIILHSTYLADSFKFLVISLREEAPWSTCQSDNNTDCVPTTDIIIRCSQNTTTNFIKTSAYIHYLNAFSTLDRNILTVRFFVLGLVWMLIFFFASVSEKTIVKIFKLSFMCRVISTFIAMSFILVSTNNVAREAFSQIVDLSSPSEFMLSFKHVSYACGIGFLGHHDFGVISSYTMVDTATVIFATVFTTMAFLRSWIVEILFLMMKRCIDVDKQYGIHILFYAILPLTTEFLYAKKLFLIYIYGTMILSPLVYMTYQMYILAKFLSYEFHSIRQIYVVGILCCVGFALSVPLLALMSQVHRAKFLATGVDITVPFLSSFYVAIVMWMYGLKNFSTDIHFWLGFRPTRFWMISWALLPVLLFCCAVRGAYMFAQWEYSLMKWLAIGWTSFTFLVVAAMNIKSIAGFLMRNNLAGVFKPHKNYGPPEVEDRKRRLYFSELTRLRKCKHNCIVLDDWYECNHPDLMKCKESFSSSSSDSEVSISDLFDEKNPNSEIGLSPPS